MTIETIEKQLHDMGAFLESPEQHSSDIHNIQDRLHEELSEVFDRWKDLDGASDLKDKWVAVERASPEERKGALDAFSKIWNASLVRGRQALEDDDFSFHNLPREIQLQILKHAHEGPGKVPADVSTTWDELSPIASDEVLIEKINSGEITLFDLGIKTPGQAKTFLAKYGDKIKTLILDQYIELDPLLAEALGKGCPNVERCLLYSAKPSKPPRFWQQFAFQNSMPGSPELLLSILPNFPNLRVLEVMPPNVEYSVHCSKEELDAIVTNCSKLERLTIHSDFEDSTITLLENELPKLKNLTHFGTVSTVPEDKIWDWIHRFASSDGANTESPLGHLQLLTIGFGKSALLDDVKNLEEVSKYLQDITFLLISDGSLDKLERLCDPTKIEFFNCVACKELTRLDLPQGKLITVTECPALTSINAPQARRISASKCPNLAKIVAAENAEVEQD